MFNLRHQLCKKIQNLLIIPLFGYCWLQVIILQSISHHRTGCSTLSHISQNHLAHPPVVLVLVHHDEVGFAVCDKLCHSITLPFSFNCANNAVVLQNWEKKVDEI